MIRTSSIESMASPALTTVY